MTGDPVRNYRAEAGAIECAGGIPILFPCSAVKALSEEQLVTVFRAVAAECDEFLGFELGEMFAPMLVQALQHDGALEMADDVLAGLFGLGHILTPLLGGHHDDRDMTSALVTLDMPANLKTVEPGEHDIKDDKIRFFTVDMLERGLPIGNAVDIETLRRQKNTL